MQIGSILDTWYKHVRAGVGSSSQQLEAALIAITALELQPAGASTATDCTTDYRAAGSRKQEAHVEAGRRLD